jgi:hypothetical protein
MAIRVWSGGAQFGVGAGGDDAEDAARKLLAPLSPAERAQLIRLLTRVLEHHSTA